MKAILVMEMPENCTECLLEMDVASTTGKQWQGNICRGCGKRNTDKSQKPDWCPLVPTSDDGTAMTPIITDHRYICPRCRASRNINQKYAYCPSCGQKLTWNN